MKKDRLAAVRRIITEQPVSTQEELIALLRADGFAVTQATASRDINELGLVKITDYTGRTRYAFPEKNASGSSLRRFTTIVKEAVISAAPAGNLVVVKCHSGMGSAAGESLDMLISEHVVGTIAGDNTIFIAAETPEHALKIIEYIRSVINP